MSDAPGLLSLYNLLARASNISCSKGASAFLSLLTTEDVSLSFAIDGFIPALQNQSLHIPQRILAAFVLDVLYVSHDHLNPFYNHLLGTFESERAIAIAAARMTSSLIASSRRTPDLSQDHNGTQAENEQFVWVLWKILQGEGNELAPYSPNILSRSTIPEHLRPLHLHVHGSSSHGNGAHFNTPHSPTEFPQGGLGIMGSPTSQNSTTLSQTRNPFSRSGPSRTPSAPRFLSNRLSSTSDFSTFDVSFPESSVSHQKTSEEGSLVDGSLRQTTSKGSSRRGSRYQHFPDPLGVPYGDTILPAFSDPIRSVAQADIASIPQLSPNQHPDVLGEQQQGLLRCVLQESHPQSNPKALLGGIAGIYNGPDMINQTGTNTKLLNESSRDLTPVLSRAPTQSNVRQFPVQNYLRSHSIMPENASSLNSVASGTRSSTRPPLDPISRPHPRVLPSQSTALYSPATQAFEFFSVDGRVSHPDVTSCDHELAQNSPMQMNNLTQQTPGIPFAHQKRTPTPTRVSPPRRSPGVIGSGRPSGSISKSDTPVDRNSSASRWSQIGIIGNGRPQPSVVVRDSSMVNRATDARREHGSMIPFSVIRMRSMKEESEEREHGIIGQPETDLEDVSRRNGDGQTSLLEKLTALSVERRAQVTSQETDMASLKSPAHFSGRGWPLNQDKTEFVAIHSLPVTPLRQSTPLQANATPFHSQPVGTPVSAADQNTKNEANTISLRQPSSPSPTIKHGKVPQIAENLQPSPFYISKRRQISETHIIEKERDELSHAIFLLLSARERVLSLTEQRMLQPHLPTLTQPLSLLRPGDIPPLVAKNTDIAAKLLLFLLDRKDEDAERIERVIRDASKHRLLHLNQASSDDILPLPVTASIDSMEAVDAIQAIVRLVSTCGTPSNSVGANDDISPFGGREAKEGYLDALRRLPPTMQSFNLIAKLLRPTQPGGVTEQQDDSPEVRVAILIRTEVLGGFVSGCVRWIEHAEQEETEGEVHDDRVAIASASLCRFYSSLLKHGFVSPASEADTIEMIGFALQFSKFEQARCLYSTLASART